MKRISAWARDHVWSTRFIIVLLIYPLLNITGWLFGMILFEEGVHINEAFYYVLSLILLVLIVFYPDKQNKYIFKNFYLRRKLHDVLLATTTFCLVTVTGNHFTSVQPGTNNPVHASVYYSSNTTNIEKPVKEKKKLKKFLKDLKKKYKSLSKAEKTGLIIIVIVVAVLLIFLLGALACNIACAGSEGLAYVVFFLGLGGIIFGAVKIIQSIKKKPPQKKEGVPST
ncbi:MAG TPA: hypothetical protein VGC29_02325 [Flavisolibacter sp.]